MGKYARMRHALGALSVAGAAVLVFQGCGSDSGSGGEHTGQSCTSTSQCYAGLDQSKLKGAVQCLSVTGGYCTHECQTDTDCCAASGECRTGFPQVCAPFESTGKSYCFLSCEASTVSAANYQDDNLFCQQNASAAFGCRSTGGGSQNRKVCLP